VIAYLTAFPQNKQWVVMTFIQHTARAVFALHLWLPCGAPKGHHAALLSLRQGPTAYLLYT
jgi:hypothetical protein